MATEIGRMQTVLEADTAAHDKALDASADNVSAVAKKTAKETREMAVAQNAAAKYGADGITTQGRRVQAAWKENADAAKNFRDIQTGMKKGYIDAAAGLDGETRAIQRQIAARREMRDELSVTSGYTQQMAASGAVRFMSGGSGGIRSVERFIDLSPRVAQAVSSIFPFIGAAGLAGMLVDMGEKGYDAFEKVIHGAESTRAAFAELHDQGKIESDDLEIVNQKIQDQIDKLSGHPNNGLYSSLLEDRKMADELVVSLLAADKARQKLFAEHDGGFLGGVMNSLGIGPAPTKTQADQLNADAGRLQAAIEKANGAYDDTEELTSDPKALQAATDKRNAAIKAAFESQIDTLRTEGARLANEESDSRKRASEWKRPLIAPRGVHFSPPAIVDNSQKIANVNGVIAELQKGMHDEMFSQSAYALSVKLGGMRQHHDGDSIANKASEARMKAMEAQLEQMKLDGTVSAKAEYDYWDARRNAFKTGSEQYNEVVAKQAELAEAGARASHAMIAKLQKSQHSSMEDSGLEVAIRGINEYNAAMRKQAQDVSKAADAQANARDEMAVAAARTNASLEELSVSEAAGKTISKYDAAVQLAALHTKVYGVEIDALNAKAKRIASANYLEEGQKREQLGKIAVQGTDLQMQQASVMMRDQQAMSPDTSAAVGAKDALNELADAARDGAREMHDFIDSSLKSINSAILNVGDRNQRGGANAFRAAGQTIFHGAANTLLTKGEGELTGALGFGSKGKPDGSAGSPFHVIMAGFGGVTIPTSLTNSLAPASSQMGTTLSKLGMSLMGAGFPMLASGGPLNANQAAIIGERGPEIFLPKTSGTVIPNGAWGGGGDTHHYHIAVDARGSSNPAEVEAAGYRGAMRAAPQIAAAAARHIQSERERTPASLRRP